jgi:malonyl-CoA/methylmalonyl-CoA synthetase
MLPIIEQAKKQGNKIAIYSGDRSFTYDQLINESILLSNHLLDDSIDLKEARVAFMVNPGFEYVKTLWAIWQAGGVAVPLCITHPLPSLQYVLEDTIASYLVI